MNAIDIVKEQVKAYEKGIAHAVVTIECGMYSNIRCIAMHSRRV